MYDILSSEILPELIPRNSKILAAVSGGPDSVALAHVLWRYAQANQDQNIVLVISHVNHGMRPEAEAESVLVKNLAQSWEIDFVLHQFNAKEYASETGKGFQEAAREWRYARWQEDLIKYNCTHLATAHHLGDQAETLLYRLIRGSGTAGLAGIYPSSKGMIRPLLTIGKKQIMDYCIAEKLPYAIDKSNLEILYDRNKIRLQLIPLLEKYNAKVQESLGRTAEVLRWDEEYIKSQVAECWDRYCTLDTDTRVLLTHAIWNLPEALLSRFLRKAIAVITQEERGIEFKFIKTIMKEGRRIGWAQDLPGLSVQSRENGLYFYKRELSQQDFLEDAPEYLASAPEYLAIAPEYLASTPEYLAITPDTEIQLELGIWYRLSPCYKVGLFNMLPEGEQVLCYEKLGIDEEGSFDEEASIDLLTCRTRKEGDKIFKSGLGHKMIKKVFQDHKISKIRRKTIPLIAKENNVIWIPGIQRSDSLLPDEHKSIIYCVFALQ